ncbi:hypothetical protein FRB97_001065 [Tulasnella sp. 331]|nr:hypothetical protein FRB97_001065 [Tulasnella sp. 331]
MDNRPRIKKHVPGAFPGAASSSGSSQSSSASTSSSSNVKIGATNVPLSSINQDIQHLAQALKDAQLRHTSPDCESAELLTPKNIVTHAQKKGKGRRSLGSASATGANTTEFGLATAGVVNGGGTAVGGEDDSLTPRAKGKGKAKPPPAVVTTASPGAARLAASKQTARSTTHATTSRHYVEVSSESDTAPDALVISTLKREVASLKKQLAAAQHHNRNKEIITPSNIELSRTKEELAEQRAQVQALQTSNKQFRESVRSGLLCGICDELLYQPWALSPCGHVYCFSCLHSWFHPEADEESDEPPKSNKTCPDCRAKIRWRPVQIFVIKSLVEAIHPTDEPVPPSPALEGPADPWEGVFSEHGSAAGVEGEDSEEEGYVDEDEFVRAAEMVLGGDYCECGEGDTFDDEGYCRFCGLREPVVEEDGDEEAAHTADEEEEEEEEEEVRGGLRQTLYRDPLRWNPLTSSWHSTRDWSIHDGDGDSNTDDASDDGSESDSGSAASSSSHVYILPSPTPPCLDLDPQRNTHLQPSQLELCNRGVPYDMIRKYDVRYDPQRGIKAHLGRNRTLWLGWNLLDIEDTDMDGSRWVERCVMDVEARSEEWKVVVAAFGGWTAFRMILQGGPEDFGHWEDPED